MSSPSSPSCPPPVSFTSPVGTPQTHAHTHTLSDADCTEVVRTIHAAHKLLHDRLTKADKEDETALHDAKRQRSASATMSSQALKAEQEPAHPIHTLKITRAALKTVLHNLRTAYHQTISTSTATVNIINQITHCMMEQDLSPTSLYTTALHKQYTRPSSKKAYALTPNDIFLINTYLGETNEINARDWEQSDEETIGAFQAGLSFQRICHTICVALINGTFQAGLSFQRLCSHCCVALMEWPVPSRPFILCSHCMRGLLTLTSLVIHFARHSLRSSLTSLVTHFIRHSLRSSLTSLVTHFARHSLRSSLTSLVTHFARHSLRSSLVQQNAPLPPTLPP